MSAAVEDAQERLRRAIRARETAKEKTRTAFVARQRAADAVGRAEAAHAAATARMKTSEAAFADQVAAGAAPEPPPVEALRDAERALDLANKTRGRLDADYEAAAALYGNAIAATEECAATVLAAEAASLALELDAARRRVLAIYDEIEALGIVRTPITNESVELSKAVKESLADVWALAGGRFPVAVERSQAGYRARWQRRLDKLLAEPAESASDAAA
jgi:hypothetical protein